MTKVLMIAALTLFGISTISPASAEVGEVRFARQLGLGYLQLYVMEELRLVEKQAEKRGLHGLKASYKPLGSPAAINDALLSDSADYGAAGVTPFIILWDKTRGNADIKAVAALNAQPAFLNAVDPRLKSLRDFTDADRIALPSVKVSLQAILLQMAAEQVFGPGQHAKLDRLTVSLAHPDGVAALTSGRTEITAHFTSPPFQYQELQNEKVHRVLSSYEITGGPASFSAIWTTAKFRKENPSAYGAVLAALEEATEFIKANRAGAARIFLKLDQSKLPQDFVEQMLADPDILYSTVPQNLEKYSDFLFRTGSIKAQPKWRDLFFPELHDRPGS